MFNIYVETAHAGRPQDASTPRPNDVIPRANYKSWTLFLICDEDWAKQGLTTSQSIPILKAQFQVFGQQIGSDNVAVWFSTDAPPSDPMSLDFNRNRKFCRAYGLDPKQGPFVVVTTTYPDESHMPSSVPAGATVFRLNNMSAVQISSFLDAIGSIVVAQSKVASAVGAPSSSASTGGWNVRILTSIQQTLTEFGCAFSFKIDAGVASADVHPCKGHA
jgi:hypothetical protein